MYTSVQETFCNTKKNILGKTDIESQSNRFYSIEEQTLLEDVSFFVCIFFNYFILTTSTYLRRTCGEWIFIFSRITMIFAFASLVKFLEVFLIRT